jgi:hypothetical protein
LELGGHATNKERWWICCCTKQKATTAIIATKYSASSVWIHHFFAHQLASADVLHLYQIAFVATA